MGDTYVDPATYTATYSMGDTSVDPATYTASYVDPATYTAFYSMGDNYVDPATKTNNYYFNPDTGSMIYGTDYYSGTTNTYTN